MPDPRWTITVQPLLTALAPVSVAFDTAAELSEDLRSYAVDRGCAILELGDPAAEAILGRRTDWARMRAAPASLTILTGFSESSVEPGPDRLVRQIDAFGGVTLVVRGVALAEQPVLAQAWQWLSTDQHVGALCAALETERRRLADAIVGHQDLVSELEKAVELLEAGERSLVEGDEALAAATLQVRSLLRRKRKLEQRLESANALAASAQEVLAAERMWVSEHVRAVAASQSWRLGHRLVRMLRGLGRQTDQGADGLTVIARRMERGGTTLRTRDGSRIP